MGKYTGSSTQKESSITKPKAPHAIWRGIGCLMILIIPAISIVAGDQTIKYGIENSWAIPYKLTLTVRFPAIFYSTPGLHTIFDPLSNIPYLYAKVAAILLYMLVISGLISLIYATIYRIVGPERYGPTDAPPTKVKVTKKSR